MSVALHLHTGPKVDVLIVDDNPFMRAAVTRILQRQGRQCVAVATLDAAKMTLIDHPTAIVLTDFSLGTRDTGVDLVRWIRAQPGLTSIPCGIMSGSDRRQITDALLEVGLGPVPVLEKPFGLGDLEVFLAALAPPRNTVEADVP
ncbi:MAG TPA: response regulator [Polyangia bacterium]|jgi:CheY-like chemotaxis protein|nr:response regulator [Polyangia bacterium]